MKNKDAGFYLTRQKGFHIVFENGYTVSVQFGPGNYCDHYDRQIGTDEAACGEEGSTQAETACWGPDGGLISLPWCDSEVQGYQSPEQVLRLMAWAASQPTD